MGKGLWRQAQVARVQTVLILIDEKLWPLEIMLQPRRGRSSQGRGFGGPRLASPLKASQPASPGAGLHQPRGASGGKSFDL